MRNSEKMKRSRKSVKRNKSRMRSNKSRKSVKRNKSRMLYNKSRKSLKGRKNRTHKNRRRTTRMKGGADENEKVTLLSLTRQGTMPRNSSFKLVGDGRKIEIPLQFSGKDYFPFNLPTALYNYSEIPVEFATIEYWNDLYKKYLGQESLEKYRGNFPVASLEAWSTLTGNTEAKTEIKSKLGKSLT